MRDIAKYCMAIHSSAANYDNTAHLITSRSPLPWLSAGNGEEWVYVDLGVLSRLERAAVTWGSTYAVAYRILVSDDGKDWREAAVCRGRADSTVQTPLRGTARYVKVLCQECSGEGYAIRRLEVFGENGRTRSLPPMPPPAEDGTQVLTGGNWKIAPAAEVPEDGRALSSPGYDDSEWLPACVPGTVLVSYVRCGAVPDPNYDDWQFQVSEAYFTADFWYRNRFLIPEERRGRRVYLNFDAVNWKADIYFNGTRLDNALPSRARSMEGAFIRGRFDVTDLTRFGEENRLAVYICKNENPGRVTTQGLAFGPGSNGGLLGADNPTLHAAVGWDWLPTIRGRDTGIYGPVTVSYSGPAELVDPWMQTDLRLIREDTAIPAVDLMLRENVHISGWNGAEEWIGGEGDGFTVDFGEPVTLGSATLLWGAESGGAAADADSRYPDRFLLESSADGKTWASMDAYPGGPVRTQYFGVVNAGPSGGSPAFRGHAGADSVQGSTALVTPEGPVFGRIIRDYPVFAPQKVRFLRFRVLECRRLNGRKTDTRLRRILVYGESPRQVEQSREHTYTLDTSRASLTFRTELRSRSSLPLTAKLRGRILPGNVPFSAEAEIPAGACVPVEIPISLDNPRLWWPNTYGEPFLYTAEAELFIGDEVSHRQCFRFGVRRFDVPVDGGILSLYCNGTRILAKGGNWGMDDGMKQDTPRSLADKVRLHAEANFTMIRNWVGMTGSPNFYRACDTYGILIWDDFWLANPVDGPEPKDIALFLENAADKIRRVRGHAALVFYCGRNEGDPCPEIDAGLRELTSTLDGTRIYFPNSAAAPVGSGGGYRLAPPEEEGGIRQYFNDVSSAVLRSERGIPNVPHPDSLRRFLKPGNLWPINAVWALHDWTYHMNGPANTYMEAVRKYLGGDFPIPEDRIPAPEPEDTDPVYLAYKADIAKMCDEAGRAWTLEDFSRAAQLINYDHHRGLFDALGARRTGGLLMWMSQSSWPSFMWQTYDYYLDTNGGYFGAKAGSQPTRAIFDPRDGSILVANASRNRYTDAVVSAQVFSLTGRLVSASDHRVEAIEPDACGLRIGEPDLSASDTDVLFLRLTLRDSAGALLGENTYWHNRREYQNYLALSSLGKAAVTLEAGAAERRENGEVRYLLRLKNGPVPALAVRVKLSGEDGSAVLPVFYSDNYLTMMPGEERRIEAVFDPALLSGSPVWSLWGWNL